MTDKAKKSEKAEQVLQKMKSRDKRPSKPSDAPPDMDFIIQNMTKGTGAKVLDQFNQSTLDDVGPWTGEGG